MKISTKTGGVLLVMAAVLMLTRMMPVMANLPADLTEFPPKSAAGLAMLATWNPTGWYFSHMMALLAFPLFFAGFLVLYRLLADRNNHTMGTFFLLAAGFGLMLFSIAVVIDGFIVPLAAENYMETGVKGDGFAAFLVLLVRKSALSFFTPAMLAIMTAVAFLGYAIVRSAIVGRWVGWTGLVLGSLAILAYVTGVAGTYWDNMRIAGSLMMLTFLWFLLIGVSLWRLTPAR